MAPHKVSENVKILWLFSVKSIILPNGICMGSMSNILEKMSLGYLSQRFTDENITSDIVRMFNAFLVRAESVGFT